MHDVDRPSTPGTAAPVLPVIGHDVRMPMTDPADFVRLAVDGDGVSHFVDEALPMTARDFAPPAAALEVSDPAPASGVVFWRAPRGWDGQQHPAPARQWVFVLQGAIEIVAGDGEARRLNRGDGILLEDVTGAGHTTRVVSEGGALGMFIQVPAERSST